MNPAKIVMTGMLLLALSMVIACIVSVLRDRWWGVSYGWLDWLSVASLSAVVLFLSGVLVYVWIAQ